ncbi:MAG: response regulator [Caulobacterales bacterium]|nr:response regulator [Caulobacterales bacterium]
MSLRIKILVVEDDLLIAMELGERLSEMGHIVLGPAHSIEQAESLLKTHHPHAALLDANVAGTSSVPLGERLAGLGVPIAFCTGYDEIKNLPPALANARVLTKPVSDAELQACVASLIA